MALKKHLLKLSEMEAIAKEATYAALGNYVPPSDQELHRATLGTVVDDEQGVFELYIPAEWPQDPKVISCARVDRATGEVEVEVFLDLSPAFRTSKVK